MESETHPGENPKISLNKPQKKVERCKSLQRSTRVKSTSYYKPAHVHFQTLAGRTSTLPATSWKRCKDTNINSIIYHNGQNFRNH